MAGEKEQGRIGGGAARVPAAAAMMMPTAMAMKCKKHPYEQGVGVCASCLRERLLALVAAQTGRARQQHSGSGGHQLQRQRSSSGAAAEQIPPPLVFPRSVSPYVSRRRSVDLDLAGDGHSDGGGRRRPLRFFSTPQVGPGEGRWKPARGRFLAFLFGSGHHSRSEEAEPEFMAPGASHRSGSWFSSLLQGRRKKKQNQKQKKKETNVSRFFEEASMREDVGRRSAWRPDGDFGGEEDDSPSESGYSTESSGGWRIPAPTPMRKHASSAHRTMSGFAVCLSPLVRASPRWTQTGEGGGAPGLPGEQRGARASSLPRHHHHRHASGLGGQPALGPNRSRKLADLGRFR